MVKLAFSDEEAQGSGGGEIDEGIYELTVDSCEFGFSKNPDDPKPMFKIVFKYTNPKMGRRLVFHNFVLTPKSLWAFRAFAEKSNYPTSDIDWTEDLDIDPKDLIGVRCKALVKNDNYNGKINQKIDGFVDMDTPEMTTPAGENTKRSI